VTLFVDSSGILALVDRDDPAHAGVVAAFTLGRSEALSTHAYVIVETLAVAAFRDTVESSVSLVDRTSFAFMHREGIERAIALDADFRTAGFETLP
jgi:predicted nucleic acid-binding protein